MGLLANLIRKPSTHSKTTAAPAGVNKSQYRGVEIVADRNGCCEAARELAGQRFLSDQVPMLPLGGCSADNCRCTYQLYDDRRTDKRRTSDEVFDMRSQLYDDDQRNRNKVGRRAADLDS